MLSVKTIAGSGSDKITFAKLPFPVVVTAWLPKSGLIFVPAIAALASICALTSPLLLNKVFISLAVWSAVAYASITFNLDKSASVKAFVLLFAS